MADRSKIPVSRIDGLDEKLKEVSGFDFEGTKAEFDAAVAAGTITEDSVSLITDDVSGDTVATKAELQDRVSKAGDTMSGQLQMTVGSPGVRFNVDDTKFFYIQSNAANGFTLLNQDLKGIYLDGGNNGIPVYTDGTNVYRLLTTADLPGYAGSVGFPNYSAATSFPTNTNFTAPSDGIIHWWAKTGQGPLFAKINNIQVGAVSALGGSDSVEYTGTFIVKKGDIFYGPSENPTNAFYPFR